MIFDLLCNPEFLLGVFAAFGGCSIRYGEYYKQNKVNFRFYIIDALTAVFLGAYTYVYLVQDLEISSINACLFNIIIGNLGSRAINIASSIFQKKFSSINNLFK